MPAAWGGDSASYGPEYQGHRSPVSQEYCHTNRIYPPKFYNCEYSFIQHIPSKKASHQDLKFFVRIRMNLLRHIEMNHGPWCYEQVGCVLSSRHKHWLDGVGVSSRRKRRWLPMVPTRTISASSHTCELQVCLIVLYFGTLTQNLGCYWQPCWKHYHLQDQLFSETKLNWIEFQEDALIEFTFLSQYLFFCVIWHCPFHLGIDQTLRISYL